jgi:hypothetical protein
MHAGKTTRAGAERVQRAWLSLTYQLQPFSGTPVRLGPRTESITPPLHVPNYTVQYCTRSVPYLEPSRANQAARPLDIAAFRSKLQGELRKMVRAWTRLTRDRPWKGPGPQRPAQRTGGD